VVPPKWDTNDNFLVLVADLDSITAALSGHRQFHGGLHTFLLRWRRRRSHSDGEVNDPVSLPFPVPQPVTELLQLIFRDGGVAEEVGGSDSGHPKWAKALESGALDLECDRSCMHGHVQEELLVPREEVGAVVFGRSGGAAVQGLRPNDDVCVLRYAHVFTGDNGDF